MSKASSQCDVRPKQFAANSYGLPSASKVPFFDANVTGSSSCSEVDAINCQGSLKDTNLSSSHGLHRTLSMSSDVVDSRRSSLHNALIWSSPSIPSKGKHPLQKSNTSLLSNRKASTSKDMPCDKKVQENIEMLEDFDPSGPLLSSSKKNLCDSNNTNTQTTNTTSGKDKSSKTAGTLVLNDDEYSQYVQVSQEMVLEHQIKVRSPFEKGKVIFISGREVVLAIGMFFSITLALGLIFTIAKERFYPKIDIVQPVADCPTEKCVTVPELMASMTDSTKDPCDDFYAYSCGGWLKTNDIPPNKKSWDVTDVLISKVDNRVKHLLEEGQSQKYTHDSAFWKAHTMYHQCLEGEFLNNSEALINLIEVMQGWTAAEVPLSGSLAAVHWTYRVTAFFNVWVAPDDKNTSRMLIQFDEGGLNLGRRSDYLQDPPPEKLQFYLDFMEEFSKSVPGIPANFTQSTFQFEKKLAKLHFDEQTLKTAPPSLFYNKLTIDNLTTLSPKIKWLTLLKAAFPEVTGEAEVLITSRDYFRQLSDLIDHTPPLILKQYMLWSVIFKYANELSPKLQTLSRTYQKKATGRDLVPRWQHCVDMVSQWMGAAVGVLYVREYVNPGTVTQVKSIVSDLKVVFKNTLKNSLWMSQTTKEQALDKLNSLKEVTGYQEEILDEQYLNRLFHNFSVVEGESLLNSSLNGVQFEISVMLQQLRTHRFIDSPATNPHDVSALYTWVDNTILIQVGILQPPHFYTGDTPTVINYGALGSIIGHEMVHGFGITGGQFDKHGRLTMWWSDTSSERFKARTDCIAKQYSGYSQEDIMIDGNMTLAENVADIEGLKIAYKGFKRVKRSESIKDDLTPEQLFFVAFAQNQCGKFSQEKLLEGNLHAMGRVRVHGTLANMDEFSSAFQCKPGSKMNPRNKCSVWD